MAYGSGSIFQRENGIWYVQVYRDGRSIMRSSKSKVRSEAVKLLKQLTSKPTEGARVSVSQILDLVLEDYARRKKRSLYEVKARCEKHVRPAFGKDYADQVTPQRIRAFIDRRRAAKAEDATINRELSILRRSFTLAKQDELLDKTPHIMKLQEDNVRQGFVDDEMYHRLMSAVPAHLPHMRPLMAVAYHIGIRSGEIRSLKIPQVDLAGRAIRLAGKQTKNGKPRTAPIYGDLGPILDMWISQTRAEHLECPWLIHWNGKRISSNFRRAWEAITKAAEMPGLLFHDFRRSAVRNLERAGVPRSVARAITGHRTESVYLRYDIVSESDIQEAAKKMERRQKTAAQPLQAAETSANTGKGESTAIQ